ncbi:MAG: ice-binding family protein [Actinomycetota bacterium]|nr:ice-binding family protein [Actinomycetota bacterium]
MSRSLAARITLVLVIGVLASGPLIANAAQPPVGLGTADSFAVLAGSGITNTGQTTITGDVGTFPTTSETGFAPCPAANCVTLNGTNHAGDAVTQGAKNDLVTAYNDAAGRTPVTTIATQLGGQTLVPGVYNSASGTFGITGTLTLDAQGDPNGVFIFQMASTLITASSSNVSLLGGAQACNVFWQVGSSATLGTSSTFRGNILALTSITVTTSVTVVGRVLARNGAVTLDTDTITRAACGSQTTPPPTTTPPSTTTPSSTPLPSGGVGTGGGSTAGLQDVAVLGVGFALLVAAGALFELRRRAIRKGSSS